MDVLGDSITMGIAAGLLFGKLIGVLGTVAFLVKLDFADLPAQASWGQMIGVALLCGIGFTMSLFIGLLAFGDPVVQDRVKIGILAGSVAAGALGAIFLGMFGRRERSAGLREQ
jgi:NhaA family Na+:H+ antiporter